MKLQLMFLRLSLLLVKVSSFVVPVIHYLLKYGLFVIVGFVTILLLYLIF